MRILVVSQYYYPEQFRVTDVCEELVNRGNEVTVVTGLPNYPEGEIYPGYEDAYRKDDERNGVKIVRCKLRPRHKGAKNLALNYLSFVFQAIKVLKRISPDFDVIYVYEMSPITLALPAIWYKEKYDIPIYFYCMDIWPECVRDAQNGHGLMSKKNPIFIVAKMISKYVYNNVDLIGNKCNGFFDYLHDECGVDKSKMRLLYEHAEEIYLSIPEKPIDNGIIDFMFLGNMGKSQNCDLFIRAIKEISPRQKVKLHFVGDGSESDNLKKLVRELSLEDVVIFHGRHPLDEVMKYYALADCCLLSLSGETASGITPPGKLYGYMAASRAIVAAIGGDAKPLIEEADCGWCVAYDDYQGIVCIMQAIVDESLNYIEKGVNGREYFGEHFTLKTHIDSLEKQLAGLIGSI